ncbi:unnamed protein product [Rodentolepis nana]|uniref:C2H2-type domain-containing protein n=1 Tax=Rodentolepis nana TaxID=102285 RepID=A0A0R3TTA6_RODNA|nr:unnamed protein product [Rodentolepis nana]
MTSPSVDLKVTSLRPSTSEGCCLATLPPIRSHQPPRHLLPPYPPPTFTSARLTPLPELPRKRSTKRTRSRHSHHPVKPTSAKSLKEVGTDTQDLQDDTQFICRLCGISCSSGDSLHAHLLLLQHSFLQSTQTRFTCRQCGSSWFMEDEKRSSNHPCLLQKAAYFRNIMASRKHVRQGLPFVCLFCCAENEQSDQSHNRRQPRRTTKKSTPLKPWRASAIFFSKLELAVHIRYVHAPSRLNGRCPECPDFLFDEKSQSEIDFWDKLPCQSIRPSSTDSILYQEGLNIFENHIKDIHMEGYEYLEWLNSKQNRSGPQELSEKALKSQTAWMYACPLCQIHQMYDDFSKSNELFHPGIGLPSNAALQAHIACFHSAGSSFLDWKFLACSVCGDFNNSSSQYNHILKEGHLNRVKDNFSTAIRQGRFASVWGKEDIEWRSTCVLCWRRFGGKKLDLRAECRLQAHLLSTHCICTKEHKDQTLLSCGWCGGNRQKDEHKRSNVEHTEVSTNRDLSELRGLERLKFRQKRNRAELFADFQWSRRHEMNHAEAIFRWWRSNSRSKMDDNFNSRRGLLWCRGSWRDS